MNYIKVIYIYIYYTQYICLIEMLSARIPNNTFLVYKIYIIYIL